MTADGKVPCQQCGKPILPATAERNGGLCMPCSGNTRQHVERIAPSVGRPTVGVTKPASALSLLDLQTFPIWVDAMDDEGAGDLEACPHKLVPQDCLATVFASFQLHNGTRYPGMLQVSTLGKTEFRAPALILGTELVDLPESLPWTLHVQARDRETTESVVEQQFTGLLAMLERKFGVPMAEIFPMAWELSVPVAGWALIPRGVIPFPKLVCPTIIVLPDFE